MTHASETWAVDEKGRWRLVDADPLALLSLLPQMDRVMTALRRTDGILHERLGHVSAVEAAGDGALSLRDADGAEFVHLPAGTLASVVLDQTIEMRDKLLPRLEFRDAAGIYVFSVTGLEGAAAFSAPWPEMRREALPVTPRDTGGEFAEVDPADPSAVLMRRVYDEARRMRVTVTLGVAAEAARQTWEGAMEREPLLMGGCINVIAKPFHLHLDPGVVDRWAGEGDRFRALDSAGRPLGLEVTLL